jgi:hypothetical protein
MRNAQTCSLLCANFSLVSMYVCMYVCMYGVPVFFLVREKELRTNRTARGPSMTRRKELQGPQPMCVCVCVYACMYVCMHTYIYTYIKDKYPYTYG